MAAERRQVAVLIGLQGSGKSSFAQRHLAHHAHVSMDRMPNTRDKAARQARELTQALAEGRSVVLDNTHPGLRDRAPWIALAHALGARAVGFFFDADPHECLARNAGRTGKAKVPPVAIFTTRKRMEPPSLREGFDALYRVRTAEGRFEVAPFDERVPVAWAGPRGEPGAAAPRH